MGKLRLINNVRIHRLERKLVYIKMDRDSYPKLIKSYDKVSLSRSSEDEHLKVRVEQSEQNLLRAQERVRQLEEELELVQNVSNTNVIDLTESNAQLSKLSLQIEEDAKTITRLINKVFELQWCSPISKLYISKLFSVPK